MISTLFSTAAGLVSGLVGLVCLIVAVVLIVTNPWLILWIGFLGAQILWIRNGVRKDRARRIELSDPWRGMPSALD